MSPVIDFYHEEVEPAFAELASLRNKKRKIKHFLRKHDLPEDVRRSLIKKMDHLERMIQTAEAPYRKKRCYYAQLDHEIKKSVKTYVDSISKDTLTVIEKLDIKEFNKSRKVNGMFSTFARGKLQRKLMEALNQKGCDFFEVAPDFTSQVCPVCSNLNAENRHSKGFCCTSCGYQDDADHVGAVNIRKRQVIERYWNCVRNTNTATRIYRMRFESYMKNGISHINKTKQHLQLKADGTL